MVPEVEVADNGSEMGESERLLRAQLRARVGTMIRGKWRIDALLGMGGMAAVFSATHRNGHACAIKMLLPTFASNAEVVRRFLKEGYVANEVKHPGVVTVTDDDVTEDGAHFLVMELLEGESFEQLLRAHPDGLDPFEALRIVQDVLGVLDAAHANGIVHRDVKPENVFLLLDGRVKLLDFGIARVRQGASSGLGTQMGVVMGTPSFMPPEQARGHWDEVDAQSDVWATGAMLYVALTGRRLRNAATTNEELLQAMTVPAPLLLSVAPGVPSRVADIVDRALAFDKASRWPSARAMQTAIRVVLGDDAPTLHQSSSPPARGSFASTPPKFDDTRAPQGTAVGLATSHVNAGAGVSASKPRSLARWGGAAALLVVVGLIYTGTRFSLAPPAEPTSSSAPALEPTPAAAGTSTTAAPVATEAPTSSSSPSIEPESPPAASAVAAPRRSMQSRPPPSPAPSAVAPTDKPIPTTSPSYDPLNRRR
jgi:serine/threonine protein kinase